MATSISSANAALVLGVAGLFTTPQPMLGFDTDDAFEVEAVDTAEVKVGVDGLMSAGLVYNPIVMTVTLQADSPSTAFFETWYAQEQAQQDKLFAFGSIRQPSVRKTYALISGALKDYVPLAPAKKVLMPRKFSILFQPPLVGVPF